jgi:hypothetical protein
MEFARRIGVDKDRTTRLLAPFLLKQEKVDVLVKRSFLDEPAKRGYLLGYGNKSNHLKKE